MPNTKVIKTRLAQFDLPWGLLELRSNPTVQDIVALGAHRGSSETTVPGPEVITSMKGQVHALEQFYTPLCLEFCTRAREFGKKGILRLWNQNLDPVFLQVKNTGLGLIEDPALQRLGFVEGCGRTGERSVGELEQQYESLCRNVTGNLKNSSGLEFWRKAPHYRFFLWKPPRHREKEPFFARNSSANIYHFLSPIGEYGRWHAWKILITTEILHNAAFAVFGKRSPQLAKSDEELLAKTARGKNCVSTAPLATVLEGLTTLGRSFTMLTMKKVGSYQDAGKLMRKIVEKNVENKLARNTGSAVLNPTVISGRYFPELVYETPGGDVDLTSLYVQRFKINQEEVRMQSIIGMEHGRDVLPSSGYGCPLAYGPGIKELSKLFLEIYEYLNAIPFPNPSFLEIFLTLCLEIHPPT